MQQVYDPLGNQALSALVAAVPIIIFLLGLTVLKLTGLKSAIISLVAAVAIGVLLFKLPFTASLGAIGLGFLGGLWPIGWIVLMAVWLYRVTVRAGNFDIIRSSVSSISADQRIQVLLIAFCFGGFLEGAAGFGIPIAICAALLVNLGFDAVKACVVALVANVAAGAYGAIGIPSIVAVQQGAVDKAEFAMMMVLSVQVISLFIPLLLVAILDGVRGIKETWWVALLIGFVVSAAQAIVLVALGPDLVDIIPPLLGLVVLALIMRKWQPKHIYREPNAPTLAELESQTVRHTGSQIAKAWSPFLILSAMILLWSVPFIKGLFAAADPKTGKEAGLLGFTTLNFKIPGLHNVMEKVAPIAPQTTPMPATWSWSIIGASGTAILIAVLITIAISNISWGAAFEEFKGAIKQLWMPILMICLVMGVANVMNYAGMSSSLGLALATAGSIFPFFSPIIGWIGVFVTGSVVNNNTLFAGLQSVTAQQIGANPALLVASNTTGGVMAKIVSPQSIAIAAAAVEKGGQESQITSAAIKYSIALLVISMVWIFVLSLFV
ncbi:L-lactate permease [Rothia terrae]|uniref:L-lactate permease n=1 Tax=Rothia terrae TaxID=396015 RepID=UPI0014472B12|nr:L-lactate permease [Rothia terrae]MDT0190325.1 L-lactate permease [Rothia terrae]NKZ34720.1 L-lactate permease [Rothia terrae]